MLILCGLPGSGKSTLAAALAEKGWTSVNQDTLGNRRACERAASGALRAGHRVVVDRCNHDPQQRAHWTRLAGTAVALWLDADLDECARRVMARESHPTLPPGAKSEAIVRRFATDFVPPSRSERGISNVIRLVVPLEMDLDDLANALSPPRAQRPVREPRSSRPYSTAGPPRGPHWRRPRPPNIQPPPTPPAATPPNDDRDVPEPPTP